MQISLANKTKLTKLIQNSIDLTNDWAYALPIFAAIAVLDVFSSLFPNTAALIMIALVYCLFKSNSRVVNLWVSIITWAYIALTFSLPDAPFTYTSVGGVRVLLWGVTVFSIAAIMTRLKEQLNSQKESIEYTLGRYRTIASELSHEQSLLDNLMDNSPDWIYFKDKRSRFVRSNKAHNIAMNIGPNQSLISKTDADFYPPEKAKEYLEEEQLIMLTGKPVINRLASLVNKEGKTIWTTSTKAPTYDSAHREIVGIVGITRDVTAEYEKQ